MNSKTLKRQRDLKNKLMAAISMLLVSSIMLVTSTYAWFTLSTAPEVTGITTAVGANGNLEMALQPYSGTLDEISSGENDGSQVALKRNVTWGNLVDVSDNQYYGLNNIVLYPAKLNLDDNKIAANPLATPKYGADGRVSSVAENTLTGAYDYVKGQFAEKMSIEGSDYTNAKGVRAIGVSSAMTARELAHRNAVSTALSNGAGANADASKSLNNRGAAIANIAVKHALNSGNETYTLDEIEPLQNAVADLEKIAARIEKALKYYVLANSIAGADAEETYADLVSTITPDTVDLTAAEAASNVKVPTDTAYTTAKTKLGTLKQAINSAKAINDLSGSISWKQLSTPLKALVDTDKIKVNDMDMDSIQAEGGKDELIRKIMANNSIAELTMPTGSGVYADIADFTGDFNAAFVMSVSYGPLTDLPVNAKMYAKTSLSSSYLAAVQDVIAEYQSGSGSESTAQPITSFYGYIIDLAFRTNAAGSYLQLQPEAVDRIYEAGSNESSTMGSGANMTFKTDSVSFGDAGVKALMENIRVIFFDTQSNEIIAYSKLDSSNTTTSTDGKITMPLMLTDETFKNAKIDNEETLADESVQIMELTQNTAHALSVMVYLDGTTMTNADVAADALYSMQGSMNLQFSSSADLTPMEYSGFETSDNGTASTPVISNVSNVKVSEGYTATLKHVAVDTTYKLVAEIKKDSTTIDASSNVTVKIGDKTATYTTFNGLSGWVAEGDATVPSEEVNVTVTSTASE